MSTFENDLARLAAEGEAAYSAAVAPTDYEGTFVAGVRRVRRRRVAETASALAVAAVAVVLGVYAVAGARGVDPIGEPSASPTVPEPAGTELWHASIGAEAWSTPVIVGDLVIAAGLNGTVSAFTLADGAPAWSTELGAEVRAPIVSDGAGAIVVDDSGKVSRIDAAGRVTWSADVAGDVSPRDTYTQTSAGVALDNGVAFLGTADGNAVALEVSTGTVLWSVPLGTGVVASGAVADGTVYLPGLDGSIHALAAEDGRELWRSAAGDPIHSSPGVAAGVVIAGSRGTELLGLDATTGEQLWAVSFGTSWAESSVEVAGDVAYVGSSGLGQVLAVDARTGAVEWRSKVGGWPWARPTYADGVVFASTSWTSSQQTPAGSLLALTDSGGAAVWSERVGGPSSWPPDGFASGAMTSPAIGPGVVAVLALDGTLAVFAR